ncbi:hypothetical protein HER10_EVM0004162 [Colletotrichum scovillei]|uniref:Uncharacterized protein n=1 Tax=Colletotrichum scovillei TaxID=1209932 RepID=A0A9P7UIV5_9PEZI|nr:uncharacterized protein HER10_EVM0004162 [Colletotrichum scovillei]KAF4782905.1 hypothetical protein HER10_EVM0004162 [Colletotrichum scovillei]KAG7050990.1 hypothetical protein JMJ77_0001619 [Colletotrichum scovillei]KAG7070028.1 hypothetical protein JMJ76_0001286 [Colletotrichum scovillei]KAG7078254.1 hypothetical protein JMJ78_0001928 [Colletotrichum scovillei]
MCQKVFYTYACQHVECVTYDCSKSSGSTRSGCMKREPSEHTSLKDQICHDCNEIIRSIRQNRHDNHPDGRVRSRHWEHRIRHYEHIMDRAQTILDQQQASQAEQRQQSQQPQNRLDQQSISPSGKTIRPLESNKLSNIKHDETFGLVPNTLYQLHVAQDAWFAIQRNRDDL